jgi:hydroxyacyl-ACP dehydratase HTD2-like protein with hotdog domain
VCTRSSVRAVGRQRADCQRAPDPLRRAVATTIEGFAGLLVHGPLLAILLLELPRRYASGSRVARFAYRARRPVIADEPVVVSAERGDTPGSWNLTIRVGSGTVAMTGHAVLG